MHEPSGTTYEAVTQADGRFFIPGMRVGGPYTVTASLTGFTTEAKNNVMLSLGVAQDLDFSLKVATVAETITVVGTSDPVFSSRRTGAATAVTARRSRDAADDLRPHHRHHASDAAVRRQRHVRRPGQPANNMTVDGSYFNNSFGLGGQPRRPHRRRADLARSDRAGAGRRRAVRRAPGQFHRRRRQHSDAQRHQQVRRIRSTTVIDNVQSFVGTNAAGQTVNPGTFTTTTGGEWFGGPIMKNKLFFFESFEKQTGYAPAVDVYFEPGRRAGGGQHDARARLGPRSR